MATIERTAYPRFPTMSALPLITIKTVAFARFEVERKMTNIKISAQLLGLAAGVW
jgi:hypothetical protein